MNATPIARSEGRAFTLVELLTVVVLIALLLAILLPAMRNAKAAGRTAVCASNLHQINQLSTTLWTERTEGRTMSLGFGWVGILTGAAHGQSGAFICPEDDPPTISPEVRLAVYSGDRFLYYMALEEGPLTRKSGAHGKPGRPGYSYTLEFEDIRPSGGDMDFNDFKAQIYLIDEDNIRVTLSKGSAGYHFSLEDSHGEVLLKDIGRQTPNGSTVMTKGRASYAVNTLTAEIYGQHKNAIYFLDYDDATTVDPTRDDWDRWEDDYGRVSFARHNGQINCLFKDGAVLGMNPDTIRPDSMKVIEKYWGEDD